MRPPGFPGNPPARMPRAPTPARSPPPRPLRRRDVAFRPTQDVGPRTQHAFRGSIRGLRAPCERFAPWVTPGPRITRFRLAAGLGRMGLDTHRVSNKVSKITSWHIVPLDRASPGARVGYMNRNRPATIPDSPTDVMDRSPWCPGPWLAHYGFALPVASVWNEPVGRYAADRTRRTVGAEADEVLTAIA